MSLRVDDDGDGEEQMSQPRDEDEDAPATATEIAAFDDLRAAEGGQVTVSSMEPWTKAGREMTQSEASVRAESELRRRVRIHEEEEDFMSKRNEREEGTSSRRSFAGHHGPGTEYHTVSYELIDTPAWHRRTNQIRSGRKDDRDEDGADCWLTYFLMCGPKLVANTLKNILYKHRDGTEMSPVEKHHRNATWVSRLFLVGLGVVAACAGFLISYSAENLLDLKISVATGETGGIDPDNATAGYGAHVALSVLFAFLAHLPTIYRPPSAGSGIAEAKAVLNGIVIPQCTELTTAVAKGISVIFAGASGLPVGLEGPMIFIGLSLGENMNRFLPRKYAGLRTARERRDLAAVGTSVGVSIAFLAPIGAVLFALEEGCSYVSTLLTWRAFSASCVTVIVAYFLYDCEDGFGKALDVYALAKFNGLEGQIEHYTHPTFHIWEYFVFALMGAVGGVLGACFIEANRALTIWRKKLALNRVMKCLEVLVIALIMSTLVWWIPYAMTVCGSLEDVLADDKFFRQFNCPDGYYNQLATLLLNPPGGPGMNLLFWEGPQAFSASVCVVAGFIYLLVLLVLFGTAISMGIFIPLLFIGACFGRALAVWWGTSVTTYAIVGSVAMLAGIARVLISLTAIMMQTTGLPYFVTPFMVVTIIARVVGKWCFGREGIYDVILELKGIPFLEERAPEITQNTDLRAASIVSSTPMVVLNPVMKVGDLLDSLKAHPHVDYPVVDSSHDDALVGVVKREHILTVLSNGSVLYDAPGPAPKALSHDELHIDNWYGPHVEEAEAALSEEDLGKFVDLVPYTQVAPHTFEGCGSAERAYEMFRTLGLRNLFVLGPDARPMGTITRSDLKILEELNVGEKRLRNIRKSVAAYEIS